MSKLQKMLENEDINSNSIDREKTAQKLLFSVPVQEMEDESSSFLSL